MKKKNNQAQETLLDAFATISKAIEMALDIELTDQDFADGREELLHSYCQAACHAALAHSVPWLQDLSERSIRWWMRSWRDF